HLLSRHGRNLRPVPHSDRADRDRQCRGGDDHRDLERLGPGPLRVDQGCAGAPHGRTRHRGPTEAAGGRAASLHGPQARRQLRFHRGDRQRVHPGAGGIGTRHRRCVRGLQQCAHVRAHPAAVDHRHLREHGAARMGSALGRAPREAVVTAARRTVDTLVIAIVILCGWQILHQLVGATALPGPAPTLSYLARLVPSARFAANAEATLLSLAFALVLAYGIGLAIGVWMGAHYLSRAVGEPILVALYSIPKITLYPVILLIFGLGMSGKVAFGALHGILPVALLAMGAIRNIPPVYLKSAETLHLSRWQTIATVLFPATLP